MIRLRYYDIIYAYWEILPNGEKIRIKRIIGKFYPNKKEADEMAKKLRRHWRFNYNLGDRIYSKKENKKDAQSMLKDCWNSRVDYNLNPCCMIRVPKI